MMHTGFKRKYMQNRNALLCLHTQTHTHTHTHTHANNNTHRGTYNCTNADEPEARRYYLMGSTLLMGSWAHSSTLIINLSRRPANVPCTTRVPWPICLNDSNPSSIIKKNDISSKTMAIHFINCHTPMIILKLTTSICFTFVWAWAGLKWLSEVNYLRFKVNLFQWI